MLKLNVNVPTKLTVKDVPSGKYFIRAGGELYYKLVPYLVIYLGQHGTGWGMAVFEKVSGILDLPVERILEKGESFTITVD